MKITDLLPIEGLVLDPSHTKMEGFENDPEAHQVRLKSLDGLIWIDIDCDKDGEIGTNMAWNSGHTFFKGKHGVRSFDRRGVEDSFYLSDWDGRGYPTQQLRETILGQVDRARKALKRDAEAVIVPGLPGGFTLTPEELENRRQQLLKTGYIRFTPAGFGTGYTITKKRSRWATPAKKELVEFLGMGPLFVETMDCD